MKAKQLRELEELIAKAARILSAIRQQKKRLYRSHTRSGSAREKLRELGISQKEAARQLGVSPAQIRAALNPPFMDSQLCYRITTQLQPRKGGVK